MTGPRFDCFCAGIVVADHVCSPVAHLPAAGELVETNKLELTIGGCASNCAVDMAILGLKTAVAGTVGRDVFGQFVRDTLETSGVDCHCLQTRDDVDTSGTLVINVAGEDRRFIHATAANAHFTTETLSDELLDTTRVLYLGGYCLADEPTASHVASLFRRARQRGVITILDVVTPGPGDYWPRLVDVLPETDLFFPNDDEARLICGLTDALEQAEYFQDAGARTSVITCGDQGAVLVGPEGRWRSGVHSVPFVDGTGSGDAFVSGYVLALLQGGDPVTCLQHGTALGAGCVQATGATTGISDAPALSRFVADHPLAIEPL